jgi:hypothetical protein
LPLCESVQSNADLSTVIRFPIEKRSAIAMGPELAPEPSLRAQSLPIGPGTVESLNQADLSALLGELSRLREENRLLRESALGFGALAERLSSALRKDGRSILKSSQFSRTSSL